MEGSERGGIVPYPAEGTDGYFTRKEAAVISALMDYLGLEGIGLGDALSLLGLVRRIRLRFGRGGTGRHECG